jgi:hypothetical protein
MLVVLRCEDFPGLVKIEKGTPVIEWYLRDSMSSSVRPD